MDKASDSYQKWATAENRTKLEKTREYLAKISGRPYEPLKVSELKHIKNEPRQEVRHEHKLEHEDKSKQKTKHKVAAKPISSRRSRVKKQQKIWPSTKPLVKNSGNDMHNFAGEYEARNVEFGHGRRKSDEWNDRSAFDLPNKLREEREAREKEWV